MPEYKCDDSLLHPFDMIISDERDCLIQLRVYWEEAQTSGADRFPRDALKRELLALFRKIEGLRKQLDQLLSIYEINRENNEKGAKEAGRLMAEIEVLQKKLKFYTL